MHRPRVPGARRARHRRRVPGRLRGELDPGERAGGLGARSRHYLFLSGFLAHRLTGRFVDSVASQVGYVPFDYKRFALGRAGDWRWQAAPVDPAWLPELVPPTERLGELTAERRGGRRAAGRDAGHRRRRRQGLRGPRLGRARRRDVASISYGTTATINTTQQRYVEPMPLVPPYPAAIARRVVARGPGLSRLLDGRVVQARVRPARGGPGRGRRRRARGALRRARPPDPAGLDGPDAPADWSPGVRVPGREAKGAIIGFGDVHTRAHLYRAILEGLAYALREGGERAAARAKEPLRELRVSGGGAQSPAIVQLTADVFGLPTGRPHTHETSGLGAAIDAAVGIGLHPDIATAAPRDDPRRRDARPGPGAPRALRASCTSASTGRCTTA